jgi:hypothetical protein
MKGQIMYICAAGMKRSQCLEAEESDGWEKPTAGLDTKLISCRKHKLMQE